MFSRNRAPAPAVWAAAWLVPVCAAAANGVVTAPDGGIARTGELVALSWTVDPAEIANRDEMELVLSLDGGKTFPVRVSRRLEPGADGVLWRVPALPTEHALLALRAGDGGESDGEELVAVSEPFAIETSGPGAIERLYEVADEWRTEDALDGAPVREPEDDLDSTEETPEVASADTRENEPEPPPAIASGPPRDDDGATLPVAPAPPPLAAGGASSRAPLPLRI